MNISSFVNRNAVSKKKKLYAKYKNTVYALVDEA